MCCIGLGKVTVEGAEKKRYRLGDELLVLCEDTGKSGRHCELRGHREDRAPYDMKGTVILGTRKIPREMRHTPKSLDGLTLDQGPRKNAYLPFPRGRTEEEMTNKEHPGRVAPDNSQYFRSVACAPT